MSQPLPYHLKVSSHFKEHPKTWDFFAAAKTKTEQLNEFKLELLKSSYKFDPTVDRNIFDKVDLAKSRLGLEHLSVHIYQVQFAVETNASIVFLDGEAHIVFSGPVIRLLDDDELLAVIAHELTHVRLFTILNGELEVTDRIITAIANNYSEAAYFETARLFRLYTEVFCDRGAYAVLEKTGPVITSLVKIATGLEKINAASYIKQAEDIFSADKETTATSVSHPDNFIRARAIELWHLEKEAAEPEIIRMIEGTVKLDQLDIFKQRDLTSLTRQVLQLYLKPKWFRSVLVLSQAKQFFTDFAPDENVLLSEELLLRTAEAHPTIRDYLCYVLLDFAFVDPAHELVAFGWAYQFSEDLRLNEPFETIIKKELKLTDKRQLQHRKKSLEAYYEVKESDAEQIYQE